MLFNQSYNKEADGALYDQDIRDIFLDDLPCKIFQKKGIAFIPIDGTVAFS